MALFFSQKQKSVFLKKEQGFVPQVHNLEVHLYNFTPNLKNKIDKFSTIFSCDMFLQDAVLLIYFDLVLCFIR